MPALRPVAVAALALLAEPALAACDTADYARGLVLSELLVDPEGADAGFQWVEIYNETGLDLNASGWRIEAGTATYDTASVFPDGTWLIDGEHVVVAQTALPFADLVAPGFVAGPGAADADAVRLVDCYGGVVDTVVYGPANPDGWLDDDGAVAASLAPPSASGQALARVVDADDTDRSGDDFALVTVSTPGSFNTEPPVTCGGPGSGLLVNELADGWVEILHVGAAPVLLSGWSVAVGTTSLSDAYTFGAGQVASPGARFVVGDVPQAAYPADIDLTGATAVRLVDCDGFASDTVVFGDNTQGWVDDGGAAASGVAPALDGTNALARYPDGGDTQDASVDFTLLPATPAAINDLPATSGSPTTDTAAPTEPTDEPTVTTDTPSTGGTGAPTGAVDDTGEAPEDQGCGCANTGSGGAGAAALALILLALTGRACRRPR